MMAVDGLAVVLIVALLTILDWPPYSGYFSTIPSSSLQICLCKPVQNGADRAYLATFG